MGRTLPKSLPLLLCEEKQFPYTRENSNAKAPELRVQAQFCDGAPLSLGFKRARTIGPHIFLNCSEWKTQIMVLLFHPFDPASLDRF